ncbi:MAG: SurA N-terminal domain-containing protein [Desulfovibrio sp.]|jgi:parvulin-like peptidyl-prolyl isomerase|nr:SurA N-terminal domain-containing protein [Desulfovibrio sp.]
MLDYIRSNAQSFGIKLAFGIIILVFVFWGVGSFTDHNSGNTVATVNGEAILMQQFEQAYQNAEDAALRNSPGITREDLKNGGLGLQVLQELASDMLLGQEAASHGIAVSPRELRQAVVQIKAFQDAQERFDPEAYKIFLAARRTSPAQYEQSLSVSLLRDKLYAMITSPAWTTPDEVKNHYNFLRQTRQVEYIFLPAKKFAAAEPAEAEMRAYYDEHREDFILPPKVAVEYVLVEPESLLKATDEKNSGTQPETQKDGTDRLHEVLDSLMEDNILNKNLNESAARFGLPARKTALLTQPEIEKTFGLAPDKAAVLLAGSPGSPVDTVLESQERYFIARVLETAPRTSAPFDDVKEAIAARLKTEKGLEAAREQAASQLNKLGDASLTETRKEEFRIRTASLQRMGNLEDFEPDAALVEAIFSSAPQQWISTVFAVDSKTEGAGALLCRTIAVRDPDPQEWQSLQGLMENITARDRADGLFQTFVLNLFARAKVEILNRDIIERKGF